MQLVYRCPGCGETAIVDRVESTRRAECAACGRSRDVPGGDLVDGLPVRCLACGCDDLWRQKDFPQRLGVMMVGLGILGSTVFWARMEPVAAIGVLMGFALIDMLLFVLMRDVLVCYRCGARHRKVDRAEDHARFNLETHERYRQEAIRLEESAGRRLAD